MSASMTDGDADSTLDEIHPDEITDALEAARAEVEQANQGSASMSDDAKVPSFPALSAMEMTDKPDYQRIPVPPHR